MTHVDAPTSICRFGIAVGDITPPVGIYHRMWGAAAHDRAEGVHRPLTATAMVCGKSGTSGSGDEQQILIALDHCLLGAPEFDALIDAIVQRTGVARDSVVVVFSHTHSAGMMTGDRHGLPGGELIPGYLDQMNGTVAALTQHALSATEEATIVYGTGRCGLAAHRDFRDEASGTWVCGYNPTGPADDTVLVARVSGIDGRPIATMVNYACHPTTLAWENRLISPDFPGAMRELVQQHTGAPCVFIQGASGDLGPVEGYVGDPAVADRNGRQLGYAALAALEALPAPPSRFEYSGPVISGATLGTWHHVPLPADRMQAATQWHVRRFTVDIEYRSDLPKPDQVEAERCDWEQAERDARDWGDAATAQQARAMAERQTRLLARLHALPRGGTFPVQVVVWRLGDAVWLAVQGEPYNLLQRELRTRFSDIPLVVAAVANELGPTYLPPADLYGTGIYQESIAILAPGCLERLTGEIEACVAQVMGV